MMETWPKEVQLVYPVSATSNTTMAVFVEDGGVRFDNAGPLPPRQVRRLIGWLNEYLEAVDINRKPMSRRRRRAR